MMSTFDAYITQFPYPSEGYFNWLGTIDAMHRVPKRTLTGEDAQYQRYYDSGYGDGHYEEVQLDRETM